MRLPQGTSRSDSEAVAAGEAGNNGNGDSDEEEDGDWSRGELLLGRLRNNGLTVKDWVPDPERGLLIGAPLVRRICPSVESCIVSR
jgi:hypothetical protein